MNRPVVFITVVAGGTALYAIPTRVEGELATWPFALSIVSNPLYLTYFVLPSWLCSSAAAAPQLRKDYDLILAGSARALARHWLKSRLSKLGLGATATVATLLGASIGLAFHGGSRADLPFAGTAPPSAAFLAQLAVVGLALYGFAGTIAVATRLTGRVLAAVAVAIVIWVWMAASTIGLVPAFLRLTHLFDAETPAAAAALAVSATIANMALPGRR